MKKALIILSLLLLALMGWRCMTLTEVLPETVASHFADNGHADAFMSRSGFLLFYAGMSAATAGLLLGIALFLPKIKPDYINLPHKRHWFSSEHRAQSLRSLTLHLLVFTIALQIFMGVVLEMVVDAHEVDPPRLAEQPFLILMAIYMSFTAIWVIWLLRRFKRPALD